MKTGVCLLSGVDFGKREVGDNPYIRVMYIILDGVTYSFEEDPSDGYRSYCCKGEVTNYVVKNTFRPHIVFVEEKKPTNWDDRAIGETETFNDKDDDKTFDGYYIMDALTTESVLRIGTDYSADWYPCCIMKFDPTGLFDNYKT